MEKKSSLSDFFGSLNADVKGYKSMLKISEKTKLNRTKKYEKKVRKLLGKYDLRFLKEFYIGGGCFVTDPINDLDIFPVKGFEFNTKALNERFGKNPDFASANADSYTEAKKKYQFCNYQHDNLQELVESFDFAHIQVGAKVTYDASCPVSRPKIEIFFTNNHSRAMQEKQTWFTGSKYPFSSLIRAFKYSKRGLLNVSNLHTSVVVILTDIKHRGFGDWEDFMDQLTSVDLEDMDIVENEYLSDLFGAYEK